MKSFAITLTLSLLALLAVLGVSAFMPR